MLETKRLLKVFLCHASQDKPVVRELAQRLFVEGWIDPWLDEKKLLPGQDWRLKIEEAVETSDIVIICLSSNSVGKEGFIQKEMRYAKEISLEKPDETIFLIPLRLDDCETPRGLRSYQWGDYFGESKDETFTILLQSLELRYLQKLMLEEKALARQEKERLENEVAEKVRIEEAERKAVERATQEKRIAAEKVKPEKVEHQATQVAALKETFSKSFDSFKLVIPNAKHFFRMGGILGIIFVLLGVGSWVIPKFLSLMPTAQPSVTLLPIATLDYSSSPIPLTETVEPSVTPAEPFIRAKIPTSTIYAGSLTTEITDAQGIQMVLVPAGGFIMGSNDGDRYPIHQVYLDDFYIDKYEVTNVLYEACVETGICNSPKREDSFTRSNYYGNADFNNYPVINVDWQMANTYCEWRGMRLPSEAEWEKAARGTDGRLYPWDDNVNCSYANGAFSDSTYCIGDTLPVGSYADGVSPYGIYDMIGNVQEWVNSLYKPYPYNMNDGREEPINAGRRVLRGGSYSNSDSDFGSLGTFSRNKAHPNSYFLDTGFRCAKSHNNK